MKQFRLLLFGLPIVLLAGCEGYGDGDNVVLTDLPPQQYEPITMDRNEFEAAVQMMPAQAIEKAGKIYIKDGYLFVNDVHKGFHIYDYSNPVDPVPLGFINVPGATDLAVRDNIVYINQATDLVTMQFDTGANAMTLLNRNENVFPSMTSPDGSSENVANDEVIIGWELI